MKQSKTLVIILLIVLMAGGWLASFLDTGTGTNTEYKSYIDSAEDYMSRGLFQKAAEQYKSAGAIKNDEQIWEKILSAYGKRYDENKEGYDDYLESAKTAVGYFPENSDFAVCLVNLYVYKDEYQLAYNEINKAIENCKKDDELTDLLYKVKYSYELQWTSYTDYYSLSNGYYAVNDSVMWSYIDQTGSDTEFEKLEYAGPVGDAGIRLVLDGKRTQLIDTNRIIQGYLDFTPVSSGEFANDLIPILNDKEYSYYSSIGDKKFGEYESASTFYDGKAAVKESKNWFLIDIEGQAVSEKKYDNIVLSKNSKFANAGYMIASENGSYSIYDMSEKSICELFCDEVDILTDDELIAVEREGKWGYVNLKGEVIIEPSFSGAKSFSNGLAAVSNGEHWGFIDTTGKVVIDYKFVGADYFNDKGCCLVEVEPDMWQLLQLYIVD